MVYYDIDGWQDVLDTNELINNDWPAIFSQIKEELSNSNMQEDIINNLEKGRNIARIIDIFDDYYICVYVAGDGK